MYYAKSLARLIGELEKLPGIGPKSAQRLAFYLLRVPEGEARLLAEAILEVKARIGLCQRCYNFTDQELCEVCRDARRDGTQLCIVAEPRDLVALERTHEYRGVYHVLHGVIAPMEGIGPEQLKVRELLQRLSSGEVREAILALNPTVEGDTTALYMKNLLQPLGLKITQIAHGLPIGGDLDYADQATLIQALSGRREMG
ncbi:MAG TPA: recombination mediator RecR [Armatimonadota bacterium]|jgi:recombination protein RecR